MYEHHQRIYVRKLSSFRPKQQGAGGRERQINREQSELSAKDTQQLRAYERAKQLTC